MYGSTSCIRVTKDTKYFFSRISCFLEKRTIHHNSILCFTGDQNYVSDAYYNLATALFPLGISCKFMIDPNEDLEVMKALVIYLTEYYLQLPYVSDLFQQ